MSDETYDRKKLQDLLSGGGTEQHAVALSNCFIAEQLERIADTLDYMYDNQREVNNFPRTVKVVD